MTDDTRSSRRLQVLCAALALGLVAALTGAILLWRERTDERAHEDAGSAAEKAARAAVVKMTTYDYRTVDDDFTWVEDAGTTAFQDYFAKASTNAIAFIKTVKASATGEVKDSAAVVEDDEHVRVLLFVDQTITSKGQKDSNTDQPRVTFHMVLQDGQWLVDQVGINDLLTD
jgi:Mce-associated membrane protein